MYEKRVDDEDIASLIERPHDHTNKAVGEIHDDIAVRPMQTQRADSRR